MNSYRLLTILAVNIASESVQAYYEPTREPTPASGGPSYLSTFLSGFSFISVLYYFYLRYRMQQMQQRLRYTQPPQIELVEASEVRSDTRAHVSDDEHIPLAVAEP
jgi:hypothetical protein